MLDLESQSIIISRNVVFHEDIFPFCNHGDEKHDFFSILNPASVDVSCGHADIIPEEERESLAAVNDSHDNVDPFMQMRGNLL